MTALTASDDRPRSLRFRLSGTIRSLVFGLYGMPYSRHGLDAGLVPFLPAGRPVTLIDIGASGGGFTDTVLRHSGIERALVIEPQPERCRELSARFGDPRFVIRQCAVSDQSGDTTMEILDSHYSSSMLRVLPEVGGAGQRINLSVRERITVPVETLDTLTAQANFTGAVDLLKIDTQGAELHVLKGAIETLRRVRMIWVEVSFVAMYEGSALFADVHGFLRNHGFRLHSIHEGFRGIDGELLQADVLFLSPDVKTESK